MTPRRFAYVMEFDRMAEDINQPKPRSSTVQGLENGYGPQRGSDIEPLRRVVAAARERLEMGEGEQVWWCETHSGSRTITHVECDKALLDAPAYPSICRMVPARLFLDKGDE